MKKQREGIITMKKPIVGILMGSQSDLEIMTEAADILKKFDIPHEVKIISAHRAPKIMLKYTESALSRGLKVLIAGAGGAAHLPGMISATTTLPVIGVPIKSSNSLLGLDSLLSIVQMPKGVPVATVAINGAQNAGILAAQIIGISEPKIAKKLVDFKRSLEEKIKKSSSTI